MTTSWTADQRRAMHRAGIGANALDRLYAMFESGSENSKLDHIVSVEDYATDKLLTADNCETALIAALAAADASTDDRGWTILVPAGDYNATQTFRVKGRYNYRRAPLIVGAGIGNTRFLYASTPIGGTYSGAGVAFWLDGSHASNYQFHNGGLEGFEIVFTGNHGGTGVYAEMLLHSVLNVRVRGPSANTAITGRTGSTSSCAAADSQGLQTRSGLAGMTEDSVGRTLTTTGGATSANNGTFVITHYVSATSVKVYNPSGTSDASNGALSWTEKYSGTGFRFRGDYTNSRGVAVTNSQNVRMDSCHASICRIGYWFESCTQFTVTETKSDQNSTHDVVLGHNVDLGWTGGMFQSAHGGYCIFELPGKVGGKFCAFRDIYQEGAVTSILKTFAPASGVADYILEKVSQGNSTTYVDCNGTRSLTVTNPGAQASPTVWAKLRNVGSAKFTGAFGPFANSDEVTKWDLDLLSREGFELRGKGKPYSGQAGHQKSLNRFLIGRGDLMAEIWDPRAARNRTVVAGNLQALTGVVNGIALSARNAGIYPTFQASNANFGGAPSWTNVAAAEASAGALKATMTLGALPVGSQPGLLCVFRLPSAAYVGGGHYQFSEWTDGTRRMILGAADAIPADGRIYGYADPIGTAGAFGLAATTDPQAAYVGIAHDGNVVGGASIPYLHLQLGDNSAGIGPTFATYASGAAGTVHWFGPGGPGLAVDNAVEIAWCGITKRGMTQGEIEQTIDLMAAEFPGIARY